MSQQDMTAAFCLQKRNDVSRYPTFSFRIAVDL
jgi:hypothetical protein